MSMLQDILSQMYIDPELLKQLDQEQQQILFRKMREEQVRKWIQREAELDKRSRKKSGRKINFALGSDGNPWVWVMGEHKNDLPYNELVRRREREEMEREQMSELQDRKEAEELAKLETRGILSLAKQFGEVHASGQRLGRGVDSVDGEVEIEEDGNSKKLIPARAARTLSPPTSVPRTESQMDVIESPTLGLHSKEQLMKEQEQRKKTLVRKASVIGKTVEEHHKFEKERTEEVFNSLRRARSISKKRAADMAKNVEHWWQESEKKAKEFDRYRRTSFKKAREIATTRPDIPEKILESIPVEKKKEIIRRMSFHEREPRKPARQAPPPPRPFKKQSSFVKPGTVPKSSAHVTSWFNDNEAPKGTGKEKDGSISVWFHGKLSRDASVKLLERKPVGSFLVRLSSKLWGYTVTVKTYTDCKHFLVDASSGKYCFVGPKQQKFNTLPELLRFYRVNPITWSGQEVLLLPVGQEDERTDLYRGLYNDDDISEEILSAAHKYTAEYSGSTL